MRRLVLFAVALSLGGCATIIEGTTQTVQVTTTPVDGARCEIRNGAGLWTLDSTPGSVTIRKDDSELLVECRVQDRSGTIVLPASLHGTVFANIAIGGVIGMGVDFATKAAWTYPAAGPVELTSSRLPIVTVSPVVPKPVPATTASLNQASLRAASVGTPLPAAGSPGAARPVTTTVTTTMASAPFAPTVVLPPENPLPPQPATAADAWNTGQVQYFKMAQQSIEDLHNKRLLSDKEYLEKMRLLSERYGAQ